MRQRMLARASNAGDGPPAAQKRRRETCENVVRLPLFMRPDRLPRSGTSTGEQGSMGASSWSGAARLERLVALYRTMLRIRAFEDARMRSIVR